MKARRGRPFRTRLLAFAIGASCLIALCGGCSKRAPKSDLEINLETKRDNYARREACRTRLSSSAPEKTVILESWTIEVDFPRHRFLVPQDWSLKEATTRTDMDGITSPVRILVFGDYRAFVVFSEQVGSYRGDPPLRDGSVATTAFVWLSHLGLTWDLLVARYSSDRALWDDVFDTTPDQMQIPRIIMGLKNGAPVAKYRDELAKFWMLERKLYYGVARRFASDHFMGYKCMSWSSSRRPNNRPRCIHVLLFEHTGEMAGLLTIIVSPVDEKGPEEPCRWEGALPPKLDEIVSSIIASFRRIEPPVNSDEP